MTDQLSTSQLTALKPLIVQYMLSGFSREQAIGEAAREARMTSGDCYAFRTEAELDAMYEVEADQVELARQTAGVCEEFPMGEFPVPGFNCSYEAVGC